MKVPSAKSPIRKASRVTPKEAEAKAKENEFLRDGISHLLLQKTALQDELDQLRNQLQCSAKDYAKLKNEHSERDNSLISALQHVQDIENQCTMLREARDHQLQTTINDNINLKEEQSRLSVSYASILEAFQDLKKCNAAMEEKLDRLNDVDMLRTSENQKHVNEFGVLQAQYDQTHGLYCLALRQLESVKEEFTQHKQRESTLVKQQRDQLRALVGLSECAICLKRMTAPVVVRCGHMFCRSCVTEWSASRRRSLIPSDCPLCRARISSKSTVVAIGLSDVFALAGGLIDSMSSVQ